MVYYVIKEVMRMCFLCLFLDEVWAESDENMMANDNQNILKFRVSLHEFRSNYSIV